MKLLFDEMLSNRLPSLLADVYPGSTKASELDGLFQGFSGRMR